MAYTARLPCTTTTASVSLNYMRPGAVQTIAGSHGLYTSSLRALSSFRISRPTSNPRISSFRLRKCSPTVRSVGQRLFCSLLAMPPPNPFRQDYSPASSNFSTISNIGSGLQIHVCRGRHTHVKIDCPDRHSA
ncbi:hypothetical protein PV10_09158 [Exophiala mesophila]|uniref:Uncharacterized protein n=1 Tax=Exophiala mesophila TaxID=212818 RepID=A0A0D1ZMI2_EXOME|nr:uncharacterized protein PV10_09158 [Exophiala mesophila]KIV87968.1 hypothetical protein PV10_09158 [Exophiala mesophila]